MGKRTHSTKPADVKRSRTINVRCTDEDVRNIRAVAEHEERSASDTIRLVMRRAAEALS